MRKFGDLKLVRSETPMLSLTWLVMHQIDKDSPLYGWSEDDFKNINNQSIQLFITLTGLDETVSQTIHARHVYRLDQILWHQRFVDLISTGIDGRFYLDYSLFHDVVPLQK